MSSVFAGQGGSGAFEGLKKHKCGEGDILSLFPQWVDFCVYVFAKIRNKDMKTG